MGVPDVFELSTGRITTPSERASDGVMLSNVMRTVMLLAPNLATYTYACPYLIPAHAVAGALKVTSVSRVKNQRKAPTPTSVRVNVVQPVQKSDMLVLKDDAWRSTSALSPELIDGEISDARL